LYETNQYSVPWTLVGLVVTVRIDAEWVRVYYRDRLITGHKRCYQRNQKPITKPEHEKGLLEIKPQGKNAHLTWQVSTLESYGEELKTYLKILRHNNRSLKTEVTRLLALATIYGAEQLREGVSAILKTGSIGVERIEMWLKQQSTALTKPEPLNFKDRNLTRIPARVELRQYDDLLFKPVTAKSGADTTRTEDANDNNKPGSGDGSQESI
jgi:hypothetical protein